MKKPSNQMKALLYWTGMMLIALPCGAKPLTMAQARVAFDDPVELIDSIPKLRIAFKKIMTPEDFDHLYSIRGPQDLGRVENLNGEDVLLVNMSMTHYAVLELDLGFAVPNRFWISIHGPWNVKGVDQDISNYYSTSPAWQKTIPFEWDDEAKMHPLSKRQLNQFASDFVLDSSMVKFSKDQCELKGLVFNDLYAAKVKNGGQKLFFKPCPQPCGMVDHKPYVVEGDDVQVFGPEVNSSRCGIYTAKNGQMTMGWLPVSGLAVQSSALPIAAPTVGTWKAFRMDSELSVTAGPGKKERGLMFKKGESISLGKESNSTGFFTFDKTGEAEYLVTVQGAQRKVRLISRNPFLVVIPDTGFPMLFSRSQ